MSFCQKHRNHHCLHAHNCKNPQHRSMNQSVEAFRHPKKDLNSKNQLKKSDKSCTFLGGAEHKQNVHINDDLLKQLHLKQQKIYELMAAESILKQKQGMLVAQNKDLLSQIQYYRDQFSTLISNNSVDTRNQINKRVKETTDLALRIKSLENQNKGLANQNHRLRIELEDERRNKFQNRQVNIDVEDKYNSLHHKLKVSDRQKQQLKQELKNRNRQFQSLQQKYQILRQQFNISCQKYKQEKDRLQEQLDVFKKQHSKFKSVHSKDKEILQMQRDSERKKYELIRAKLYQFEQQNKNYTRTVKTLQQKCEQLEEDLTHAKTIISKHEQLRQDYSQIQQELHKKNIQERTIIREHQRHQYEHKQTNKQNQQPKQVEKLHLQQEISALKKKIAELESKNTVNYEQIILNLGASEAFKRLLEQKNSIIKKLIRQKGEIYNKMAL